MPHLLRSVHSVVQGNTVYYGRNNGSDSLSLKLICTFYSNKTQGVKKHKLITKHLRLSVNYIYMLKKETGRIKMARE